MRNGKVSKVLCVLAHVALTATVVGMFMLFVQTITATPAFYGVSNAECGSMSTSGYVVFGGLVGTLLFGWLAYLTEPRENDSDPD